MELKSVSGRVIVKADKEQKNFYTFKNGVVIRMERDYNNLDRSYTQQVLGEVVDAEKIPAGSLVLFHFNSLHETNLITNADILSGEDIASGIKTYSIPEENCYLWKQKEDDNWQPCNGFATALRVFEPYKGMMQDIPPTKVKDVLYVTSGIYKGKVVKTLKACDASIIFRNEKGVDETIIRFRPLGDEKSNREPEAIAIMESLTSKVNNGDLYIGIDEKTAQPLLT